MGYNIAYVKSENSTSVFMLSSITNLLPLDFTIECVVTSSSRS